MFSSRLAGQVTPNALSRALSRARQSGTRILDLTETNPTAVGLRYPDGLLLPLADPAGEVYQPHPFGLDAARRGVAASYRSDGAVIDSRDVVLTASTSEAYGFLFKLLCNPGDQILVPQPSYPLFDMLSTLEGVRSVSYRLNPCDAWAMDRAGLERALTPATRAILVVSPNNPTGSMVRSADRDWLAALAERDNLAIVSDEVFADYPLSRRADATSFLGERRALTFTLGGLSKSAGLPQAKLAWIVVSGPDLVSREALDRLELIADTYLSVSTPVQVAASRLIDAGRGIRSAILTRIRTNLAFLRGAIGSHPGLTLFEPEGGWSAVIRVPALTSEEEIVLHLLDQVQVLVHPGYFFDFPNEAFLVLSLLPESGTFNEAVTRLCQFVAAAEA